MSELWFNVAANTGGTYYGPPLTPYQPPGYPAPPTGTPNTPLTPDQPLTPYQPPVTPANPTISCDSCPNGVPISTIYTGNTCPTGSIPSGTGNPCVATNQGYLIAQVYDIVSNVGGSSQYNNVVGPTAGAGMRGQVIQVYSGNPSDYTIMWQDGTTSTVQGESTQLYTITGFQAGDRIKKNQTNEFGTVLTRNGNAIQVRWDNNTTTYDMVSNQIFVGVGAPMGCTDAMATNYNPNAGSDDGSCVVPGCTDPLANNLMMNATTDNGSCTYDGCTDPTATNYNPAATVDDGSCISTISGCTDSNALNYNSLANTDDGSCSYPLSGCTDPAADNYNPNAVTDDGSCQIFGCTDPTKFGYNPDANVEDGSCQEVYSGCTYTDADNYDDTANTNDGSCVWTGCTDANANNQAVLAEGVQGTIISDNSLCDYSTDVPPTPVVVGTPSVTVGGFGPTPSTPSECEEDEMKIAGNCIKKNLVYIGVAVALYLAYSRGMFKNVLKK